MRQRLINNEFLKALHQQMAKRKKKNKLLLFTHIILYGLDDVITCYSSVLLIIVILSFCFTFKFVILGIHEQLPYPMKA